MIVRTYYPGEQDRKNILPRRTGQKDPIAKDSMCFCHRTQKNQTGIDLEAPTPWSSFHGVRKCHAGYWGRKSSTSSTALLSSVPKKDEI